MVVRADRETDYNSSKSNNCIGAPGAIREILFFVNDFRVIRLSSRINAYKEPKLIKPHEILSHNVKINLGKG